MNANASVYNNSESRYDDKTQSWWNEYIIENLHFIRQSPLDREKRVISKLFSLIAFLVRVFHIKNFLRWNKTLFLISDTNFKFRMQYFMCLLKIIRFRRLFPKYEHHVMILLIRTTITLRYSCAFKIWV